MSVPEISTIKEILQKSLDVKRYEHSLGVAYTAAALAMCYGIEPQRALLAGLLHDCAKRLPAERCIHLCESAGVVISDAEMRNPSLLHAKAGSLLAHDEFMVSDPEILDAIRYHTTGRPGMGLLEKIIFLADYIEPSRKIAPNLSQIRKLSFVDPDAALVRVLSDTLNYLRCNNKEIDTMTEKTLLYYNK